jgi:glycosyltransferase involved in cell wall biosynthesis
VRAAFELDAARIRGESVKVLVVTTEPLPYPGFVTTGAGLRAWGLAEGLKSAGFSVTVAMPENVLASRNVATPAEIQSSCYKRSELGAFIHAQNPDVLVLQHWGLASEIERVECPLAIDLAGAHLLERLYWGSANFSKDVHEKLAALRRADFLVCSGEWQRHYFLPFLGLAGYDVTSREALAVIPFSVPPEEAPRIEREPNSFVYSGVFLPWQNPERPIRWLLEALEKKGKGRLYFYGGVHPLGDVSRGRFDKIIALVEGHPRVTNYTFVPYDALIRAYCGDSVALDLLEQNPERELAFTSRTMIYLWCGLPVIYNNYSELSAQIARYDAGWALDPEDREAFQQLIGRILEQPEEVERRGENARKMIRERYTWDRTIAPLAQFCAQPEFRKNKEAIALAFESKDLEIASLRGGLEQARSELLTLKGKKIFKLYERVLRLGPIVAPLVFLISIPVSLLVLVACFLADSIGQARRIVGGNAAIRKQRT